MLSCRFCRAVHARHAHAAEAECGDGGPFVRGGYWHESIATIHAALDAGITLIDTGDFYGMGHNEMLIAEALKGVPRQQVIVSVKFGALRDPAGGWLGNERAAGGVKSFLAYSLQRLGVDYIDIYRPARLDPGVPIEETVGAIADMVKAGYVRHIGLSEVGVETIRRAAAVHPITDLQIEYSLISARYRGRDPAARSANAASRSRPTACSRAVSSAPLAEGRGVRSRFRAFSPRFQGDNVAANLLWSKRCARSPDAKYQRGAGGDCLGGGARRRYRTRRRAPRDRLAEALGAIDVTLSPQDIAAIERAVPKGAAAGSATPPPRWPTSTARSEDGQARP